MTDNYVERILTSRVYDVAVESPLDDAAELSQRLGCRVLLKREDLQSVFSFKLRGAYNKLASLPAETLANGVVCASAGNHAQGVALAARKLGTTARIVMPRTTPAIKVEAVSRLGGEVIIHGDTYDEACEHATALASDAGATFVHPFDDPDVIAGQGTVGMELVRQCGANMNAVFVPVGGGGLAAGVSVYIKRLLPGVRVIGVEPADAACMHAALAAGKPVTLEQVGVFADGASVKRAGTETFRLCSRHLDEIVRVDTDEICAAIKDIFSDTRTMAEPAGALAVAGLKQYAERSHVAGQTLVAVHSGANLNFDRLGHIAERANIGEHTEALLAVEIPEEPGSFQRFCRELGRRVVTEFNYRYSDTDQARIFVGLRLSGGDPERADNTQLLARHGYAVHDMTGDELAKMHVRYMVGGYNPAIEHERLFRFRFPERRGALLDFLGAVGPRWNISLFHYRNHGSDYGRVLAGVQVPPGDATEFAAHLDDLGYFYQEETDGLAYRLFLGAGGAH